MRILIAGAGSLGSVYGGFLARAGHEVQLLARDAHVAAITAAGGLRVESLDDDLTVPLRATTDPAAVEPVQAVILLTKTPDSTSVLGGLTHLAGAVEVAVSLQNGVVGAAVLADWCGQAAVIGGVSMVGGTLVAPGTVRHTFAGPTFLGELDGAPSERVAALAAALDEAGLETVATDRIRSVEWSKLVHANPSMAVTALTRLDFHLAFTTPPLAAAFLDLVTEGAAIAAAGGVELDDWPHLLPVRTLADLPRDQALARIHAHGRRLEEAGMTQVRISMLQSIERGRRTEVDAIQGHLVREADRLGVPAPATRLAYRLLSGLDAHLQ